MRLFIATPVSPEIRAFLSAAVAGMRTSLSGVPIKWVAPSNFHLTFRFLGETPEADIEPLAQQLSHVCQQFSPLDVLVGGLGCFPDASDPRVLWMGLTHPSALVALYDAIQQATARFGAKDAGANATRAAKHEAFSAHLTLARLKGATRSQKRRVSQEIARQPKPEPCSWRMDRVVLMESQLTPSGSCYRELASFELSARAAADRDH
jgi:2'-5' RNA ligase